MKLVSPASRRRYHVLVVGSGLAGAAAAASFGELGYKFECFSYHDSPRRAHSIAAQGGINAAKNYRNDGDSVFRLFYDTVKGGDFRGREANVYRLAELSLNIIDQCVAQGVPFAREYGGLLDTRSFGGAQVSRTFYARGQTGQQLLLGAYQALERQVGLGTVTMHTRAEMLDLVVVDGRARGIVTRNLVTGAVESHVGDAVVLATGGYGNVFYLSTNAKASNATAIWRAHRKGAAFANPCFTQIHPTCIPASDEFQSKLTLMSESLRNDGRIWVPMEFDDPRPPNQIPENERDYYLERRYPAFGNLVPRDVASRAAKLEVDKGLADGYFVLPYTVPNSLAGMLGQPAVPTDDPVFRAAGAEVADRTKKYLSIGGTRSVDDLHRELGKILWDNCGMARSKEGLEKAISEIAALRVEFDRDLRVLGSDDTLNQSLEKAGRVDDFFELAGLLCRDALHREESWGGHFRVEHQSEDGEAQRNDDHFAYAAAWEYAGPGAEPVLNKEPLTFDHVHLAQ